MSLCVCCVDVHTYSAWKKCYYECHVLKMSSRPNLCAHICRLCTVVILVSVCVCEGVCGRAGGGRDDFLCSGRNRQCLLALFQFVGGRVRDSSRHNREEDGEMKLRQ